MCNVNYVSEFNAMMRYAAQNGLTGRERLLWIALFYAANDRAEYNAHTGERDWPQGFFGVAHSELNLLSTLNKKGVEEIRNSLKQRGLIDFKNGSRNKAAPMYKLNYLTVGVEKDPNIYPREASNKDPNNIPKSTPKGDPRTGALYLNKRENEGGGYPEEEEEINNHSENKRAREIMDCWKENFGYGATPAMIDDLAYWEYFYEFRPGVVEAVINRAAKVMPRNIGEYIGKVLRDLAYQKVTGTEDMDGELFAV